MPQLLVLHPALYLGHGGEITALGVYHLYTLMGFRKSIILILGACCRGRMLCHDRRHLFTMTAGCRNAACCL